MSDVFPEPGAAGVEHPVAVLVTARGDETGRQFVLARQCTTIGRDRCCDVVLADATVSRRHAEIYRDGERYTLVDVGSLNGLFLNRRSTREAELAEGDGIWIGKARFVFSRAPPPPVSDTGDYERECSSCGP